MSMCINLFIKRDLNENVNAYYPIQKGYISVFLCSLDIVEL